MENNNNQDAVLHVALDTNLIVQLGAFMRLDESTINKMMNAIDHGRKRGFSDQVRRAVSKDERFLAEFSFGLNNTSMALEEIANLYYMIIHGKLKAYILPSVASEIRKCGKNAKNDPVRVWKWSGALALINKGDSPIIQLCDSKKALSTAARNIRNFYNSIMLVCVDRRDVSPSVMEMSKELQEKVVRENISCSTMSIASGSRGTTFIYASAMSKEVEEKDLDNNPDDSYIAAEASLFGLYLLTQNVQHFISFGVRPYNTIRARMLEQINRASIQVPQHLGATPVRVIEFFSAIEKQETAKYEIAPRTIEISKDNKIEYEYDKSA